MVGNESRAAKRPGHLNDVPELGLWKGDCLRHERRQLRSRDSCLEPLPSVSLNPFLEGRAELRLGVRRLASGLW
jgi:hypothetical protein